jgi:hypothetical protein
MGGAISAARWRTAIIVERNHRPLAVLRAAAPQRRTVSESIALAVQREKQRGYAVTLDPEFAAEVEQIVGNRKPWTPSWWD